MQASQWAIASEAFAIALVGWAVISLICAPFIVVRNDRLNGRWVGRQFIYHRPILVATVRCLARPDGETERYPILFKDAEESSFVHYSVEFERNVSSVLNASVFGSLQMTLQEPGKGISYGDGIRLTGGMVLNRGKKAELHVRMIPSATPVTARVYCLDFTVGKMGINDV